MGSAAEDPRALMRADYQEDDIQGATNSAPCTLSASRPWYLRLAGASLVLLAGLLLLTTGSMQHGMEALGDPPSQALAIGYPGYTMHRRTACIDRIGASIKGMEDVQKKFVRMSVYCAQKCNAHKDCAGFVFRDKDIPGKTAPPAHPRGGYCWLLSQVSKDMEHDCLRTSGLRERAEPFTTYVRNHMP
ncbi:unnamed protein product [Symbiodinium microadriaticum]|nr:unnamed protein product [Symbiodinium microadriaticum]CAE7946213.1 unnamed protein product [Symbiodinium sp. KB8]